MKRLLVLIATALSLTHAHATEVTCFRAAYLDARPNQYAHIQLWNPGPNTLILERVILGTGNHGSWVFGRTLDWLPRDLHEIPQGINAMIEHNTLGCTGEIRGADGLCDCIGQMINTAGRYDGPFRVVIPPNHGMMLRAGSRGVEARASFQWREVSVVGH